MNWKVGESRAMLGNWDALYCTWWSFSLYLTWQNSDTWMVCFTFFLFFVKGQFIYIWIYQYTYNFFKAFLYVSRLLFNVCMYVCMASVMENFDVVCALLAYCKKGTILTPPAPSLPLSVCNKEVVTTFFLALCKCHLSFFFNYFLCAKLQTWTCL